MTGDGDDGSDPQAPGEAGGPEQARPKRPKLRLVESKPTPEEEEGGLFGRRPESPESPQPSPDGGPYPDPRTAFWLTLAGVMGTGFIGIFFFDLGMLAAVGIGHALAVGAIASFAAQRVAEPQTERMGLRGFDPGALPLLLCLVPAILVVSELDNFAMDLSPEKAAELLEDVTPLGQEFGLEIRGDDDTGERLSAGGLSPAEQDGTTQSEGDDNASPEPPEPLTVPLVDPSDPWTIAQAFVISVGIAPLVDEFFFRGVIQQSMVARLGLMRGIAFVALLYTTFHLPAFPQLPRLLMGLLSSFGLGMTLGLVRAATGSILAPILLAGSWSAVGVGAMALRDKMPLPGLNVDGTHLPLLIGLSSFGVVAWALSEVVQEAERRYASEDFDPSD